MKHKTIFFIIELYNNVAFLRYYNVQSLQKLQSNKEKSKRFQLCVLYLMLTFTFRYNYFQVGSNYKCKFTKESLISDLVNVLCFEMNLLDLLECIKELFRKTYYNNEGVIEC